MSLQIETKHFRQAIFTLPIDRTNMVYANGIFEFDFSAS